MHNLTGRRFGRLSVLRENGRKNNRVLWLCMCDCGNELSITSNRLLHKEGTKSCGCLRKESIVNIATKHGKRNDRIYRIWCDMKKRCNNEKSKSYYRYGGRGINVCDRWLDFNKFYEDMKPTYGDNLTIDRIDFNKGYEPSNCRWVTQQEQLSNYSKNVFITINNETDTVKNMCKKYNRNYDSVIRRIKKGIDPIIAMTAIYRNGTDKIIGYKELQ